MKFKIYKPKLNIQFNGFQTVSYYNWECVKSIYWEMKSECLMSWVIITFIINLHFWNWKKNLFVSMLWHSVWTFTIAHILYRNNPCRIAMWMLYPIFKPLSPLNDHLLVIAHSGLALEDLILNDVLNISLSI